MTQKQNLYEGMYIFSPTLSEEARNKALEKVTSDIEAHGGSIEKVLDWGRRKLAYRINRHRDGYYYLVYFKVAPAVIEELRKENRLNEDLLRDMMLRAEEVREDLEFEPIGLAEKQL